MDRRKPLVNIGSAPSARASVAKTLVALGGLAGFLLLLVLGALDRSLGLALGLGFELAAFGFVGVLPLETRVAGRRLERSSALRAFFGYRLSPRRHDARA